MGKVFSLIRVYFREHFHTGYFIVITLFTATLIAAEYTWDLERTYIDREPASHLRLLRYCLMYVTAFGGAYLLLLIDRKSRRVLRQPQLWILILLAATLFSVRTWFHHYEVFTDNLMPYPYRLWLKKCIINLQGLIFLFLPLGIYWWFFDRKFQPVYGFHYKDVSLRPYFVMLLIMLPLVVGAATQADFLDTYPRAFHLYLPSKGPHNAWMTFLYEICYSVDFITTEFFFRGFLILALARFAGPQVILPMCVFYVVIHFGKPIGETISSFFGGWLLGILAYETKSIYGGIIVHLGIAWMMEAVAYAAYQL